MGPVDEDEAEFVAYLWGISATFCIFIEFFTLIAFLGCYG